MIRKVHSLTSSPSSGLLFPACFSCVKVPPNRRGKLSGKHGSNAGRICMRLILHVQDSKRTGFVSSATLCFCEDDSKNKNKTPSYKHMSEVTGSL